MVPHPLLSIITYSTVQYSTSRPSHDHGMGSRSNKRDTK